MRSFTLDHLLTKTRTSPPTNDASIALSFRDRSFTYDELDERAETLSSGLLAAGFQKGDRLCVVARNRHEWFELYFALAKIGGVLVPVNYLLKASEIQYIVEDSGARWVVCEDEFWPTVDQVRAAVAGDVHYISLDGQRPGSSDFASLRAEPGAEAGPRPDVSIDDLFLLQYTSGTTGLPKGAMHTHATVLWNAFSQVAELEITRDDVALIVPALCWSAGFNDFTLATLWTGGRVVLNPSGNFEAAAFFETVQAQRVTKTLLVPSVLKRVLASQELERYDLSSLDLVLSGGEPVPVSGIEEFHERLPTCALMQAYGMSEFPALMLYLRLEDAKRKAGSAGKASLITEIRVVDEEGEDADHGQLGEILCRSPATMIGYYKQPDATAQTLTDGWLHTGDLAHVDEEGFVYIVGRSTDMIITGGLNVYPAEIEDVIAEQPGVVEAAVIGVEDEKWGEIGHAFVVTEPGTAVTSDDLEVACREALANYKVPRLWTFRGEPLPRTTSGKIQKFQLSDAT